MTTTLQKVGILRSLYAVIREAKLSEQDSLLACLSMACMISQKMGMTRSELEARAGELYDKTRAVDPSRFGKA